MGKFIFVTGGVVSGLGKGITVASLGQILKSRGLNVTAQKLDPYINVDPGTMSPYQHGEVFVTEDGAETDLDLGHYERFMNVNLNKFSYLAAGKVYWNVINKERKGEYLGKTVQVIPHITDEIKKFIYSLHESTKADVVITEIGGTVGDIEGQPFIESIRQISLEVGKENCLFIHLTLVPYLGEFKTKPTQHSVKELRSLGINPDITVVRSEKEISPRIKDKIALFCSVKPECVISNVSLPSLYSVPLMLEKNHLSDLVVQKLSLKCHEPKMNQWKNIVERSANYLKSIKIAVVGKYTNFKDAYLSVTEALRHAGFYLNVNVDIEWIDAEFLTEESSEKMLKDCKGILVPGGFGPRGIDGMIVAAKYAREHNVPYLGICLGMQIAVIEFARNVLKINNASSSEFSSTCTPVISLLSNQKNISKLGGSMRLGTYPCNIKENTLMSKIYQQSQIYERHRHRYGLNNEYRTQLESNGLAISGTSPDGFLVEAVEYPQNQFFVGVQYHPEFKSRPEDPSKIFYSFIEYSLSEA